MNTMHSSRSSARRACASSGRSSTKLQPTPGRRATARRAIAESSAPQTQELKMKPKAPRPDMASVGGSGAAQGGHPNQHKTKIICTIGPASESMETLRELAQNGMDVARLNMTHGDHQWHATVIERVREINRSGFNVALMMDTEGSEAHLRATDPVRVERGDELTFSVRPSSEDNPRHFQVSYEAFIDDVRVGDAVVMDGGMVIVRVDGVAGPDVTGTVIEPGKVMSRATLTLRREKELVRGYSSMLPVVTAKDWQDIDFAVEHKIDILAISFVRDHNIIENVRSYVNSQLQRRAPEHSMDICAKMEAYDSVAAMPEIIQASDSIMVARSDLGAQIPMEDVPAVQREIVFRCRQMNKPVFVASQLLNSMIDVPVPTRAEVADCADAVRQQADALMLSGETAAGAYPVKAVQTLQGVYSEVEAWVQREKFGYMKYPALCAHGKDRISEEICTSAANISSRLQTAAIFVYTRTGQTAGFVSRRRPACPIFAVTDSMSVYRRLACRWGVTALLMPLSDQPENNVQTTFDEIADLNVVKVGDLVVVVSDIITGEDTVRSLQVRNIL